MAGHADYSPITAERRAEVRAMLTAIRSTWDRELADISIASLWPVLERAIVAMTDDDPRRRRDAIDRAIDDLQRAVDDAGKRQSACDEWTRDHDPG
jgi:hypothetical protein